MPPGVALTPAATEFLNRIPRPTVEDLAPLIAGRGEEGVRILLAVAAVSPDTTLRTAALRALGTVPPGWANEDRLAVLLQALDGADPADPDAARDGLLPMIGSLGPDALPALRERCGAPGPAGHRALTLLAACPVLTRAEYDVLARFPGST